MDEEQRTGLVAINGRRFRWGKAIFAGLIAGFVLLVVNAANPWGPSGMINTRVMGRAVETGVRDPGFSIEAAVLHLTLSVVYALVIIGLVYRLEATAAVLAGGAIGIGLYLLNFLAFRTIFSESNVGGELIPFLIHIVFGLFAVGAYKGMQRRRQAVVEENY